MNSAFAVAIGLDMIRPTTVKDISTLCANIFLPALLFASIGGNIAVDNLREYIPVFVWSLTTIFISMALGKVVARAWKLPSWTVAAIALNNTTSLPILLTKSFASTGILSSIAGSDIQGAVDRATSYYLVSSLVAKVITFTLGPYLFDQDCLRKPSPQESPVLPSYPSESTSLLTKHRSPSSSSTSEWWSILLSFSPVTWSAILAVAIGLFPPLHQLFFSLPQDGGYLSTWLSGSLLNIGQLFAVLTIFTVGAKLSHSFQAETLQGSPRPPLKALLSIFAIRFVVWSAVSLSVIYWVVVKTSWLPQDPILWWCLIMIPIGPPAMTVSILVDVIGVDEIGRNLVARTLANMYIVTPAISFPVVAALKLCEILMEMKGLSKPFTTYNSDYIPLYTTT
ncbi:hypothetical protein AN958_03176 [Leucoagaricus sp. SymC.cos]|nr:hypothetical protein AN958_03176 [Leucoagaricus sp. SymC.cos]